MGSPSYNIINFQKLCAVAPISHYYTFTIVTMVFWWKLVTSVHFKGHLNVFQISPSQGQLWKHSFQTKSYQRSYEMLIVLTWDELVLVWMMDRLLPPRRTCRAHTRPPERKSGGHSLWRTPHFPLLPPFLQRSSFSSFPLNFGHQSVQKKI